MLKYDAKIFETKFAQESRNQFDDSKGGEAWKVLIRGYLLGKIPMMKHILKWAEDSKTTEIHTGAVGSLGPYISG